MHRYRLTAIDKKSGDVYFTNIKETGLLMFCSEGMLNIFNSDYVGILDRKTGLVSFYPPSTEFPREKMS